MATKGTQGKPETFFLTGCASGIGQHLADRLISEGRQVIATDADFEALSRHALLKSWPAVRTLTLRLDVRELAQWEAALAEAVKTFGRVDVLMNIAGLIEPGWVHEAKEADVHRHFDVNTKGVVFGTQVAARQMLRQGYGHIINIGSLSSLAPIPGISLYSASKYAVRAFSLCAAAELKPKGIYVTVVCPDVVRTPMMEREKIQDEASLVFSAGKLLTVEQVADLILGKVLDRKPLEAYLPRSRAPLLRLADLFPALFFRVAPLFARLGKSYMQKLERERLAGTEGKPL